MEVYEYTKFFLKVIAFLLYDTNVIFSRAFQYASLILARFVRGLRRDLAAQYSLVEHDRFHTNINSRDRGRSLASQWPKTVNTFIYYFQSLLPPRLSLPP